MDKKLTRIVAAVVVVAASLALAFSLIVTSIAIPLLAATGNTLPLTALISVWSGLAAATFWIVRRHERQR